MTAATVLIPTHEHVEPLRHAVASAQAQTLADFELFIVGDGVTDATRALEDRRVAGLSRSQHTGRQRSDRPRAVVGAGLPDGESRGAHRQVAGTSRLGLR